MTGRGSMVGMINVEGFTGVTVQTGITNSTLS